MAQALKRIQKEFNEIIKNRDILYEKGIIDAGPIDDSDMYEWEAEIRGPEDTPYEDGTFKLKIDFPKDYPFKPPRIVFVTKIFHVNIHSDGKICCKSFQLLYDAWSPFVTVSEILIKIINLLKFPNFQTCRLYGYDDSLVERCYDHKDYKYYNKIANDWTVKYAEGSYNDYYYNDGNVTEFNEEITDIINNCETELNNIVNFYLQLEAIINESKNRINKEKIKIKELSRKFNDLNYENLLLNKIRLKDLRNELKIKENEITDLYLPLQIKEKLMTITIISSNEIIHFSITCHKKVNFSKIEELFCSKYPEYKNNNNRFYLKGKLIDKNKNLENNKINDNDIIMLKGEM